MRMAVGQVPERRPGRVAALDGAHHRTRRPVGGVGVFRQVPRAADVAVVAHAVAELPAGEALVAEEQLVVVGHAVLGAALLVQNHVVEADAVALRVDVQLADRVGLVAGGAKRPGKGGQVRHRHAFGEHAVAVGARAGAGHQRAPRRDAHRALRVGVGVADAGAGERVEGGGLNRRVAGAAEQRRRPVVGGDQEHVGTLGHGVQSSGGRC